MWIIRWVFLQLDTGCEARHLALFFVFSGCRFSGLMPRIPKLFKCSKSNFTLKWLQYSGNTSFEKNLRLKSFGCLLFITATFCMLFHCLIANFWLLSGKQSHSLNINYCNWAINFWPEGDCDPHNKVGSLLLVKYQLEFEPKTFQFDCNPITH